MSMTDHSVLAVDVGGSHVKAVVSTNPTEMRRFVSGPHLGPAEMVAGITDLTRDWAYDAVSVGIPAPVPAGRVVREPVNLGRGWVDFDFAKAFGRPTKVIND